MKRTKADILADIASMERMKAQAEKHLAASTQDVRYYSGCIETYKAELARCRPAEFTWPEGNDHWITMDCDTFAKRVLLTADIAVPEDLHLKVSQPALLANPGALKELISIAKRIVHYSQDV